MTDYAKPGQVTHFRFVRRPSPVLPEHRPLYKIGQVLLVLQLASRGGKSSLPRLHLFNWALKTEVRQVMLVTAADRKVLSIPAWGFDPALAIGVRIGIAEGLMRENNTGYEITEAGELFVREIIKDSDIFSSERAFLSRVGKGITENMVDDAARGWETE
jgi:hypothetical protein